MAKQTTAKLKITIGTPKPIVNNLCLTSDFGTSTSPKVSDAAWQALVNTLQPIKSWAPLDGSRVQHLTYKDVGSNCYNIDMTLEAKRVPPQTLAQINNGVCNRQYGYGFYQDTLGFLAKLNPVPKITVHINIVEPILRGTRGVPNYTSTFSQIDFVIASAKAAGVGINVFALGAESGTIDDVFTTSQMIFNVSQAIANYITAKGYKSSGDPNLVDDPTMRLKDLNASLNKLVGVDCMRQYYHKYENNYADARIRVAGFQAFCDLFKQQFPNKKMRIEQQQVVPATTAAGNPNPIPNPLKGTCGEGLLYAEELLAVIKNGTIEDYHCGSVGRFIDEKTITPLAPYNFIMLLRGAQQNDGAVTVEIIDGSAGSENLLMLAVKKGSGTELYIVNPTASEFSFESLKVDTLKKTKLKLTSWYTADPMNATPLSFTYEGPSPVIKHYSLTKIVA